MKTRATIFHIGLYLFLSLLIGLGSISYAQTATKYEISFERAVHHEAEIRITFANIDDQVLQVVMSRSSPGRYALHEFAKNVYSVQAFNGKGEPLNPYRSKTNQWDIAGHDGTVIFKYTLFGNRGDGTYTQIDESHAHLNMPATFAWARGLEKRPIEITFKVRNDLNWKVATQLEPLYSTTYFAPNLEYFLDSPTEIADFHLKEQVIDGHRFQLALHTNASTQEVDSYFSKLMKIVQQQKQVFGEFPSFDFKRYVFLGCFVPNASGDGMEHRNSTYVVNAKPLDTPLGETSLGTMSHEFFHAWNVERIRPASLEPFNFEETNISGELWFAEGFTSYYTNLILVRAGLMNEQTYLSSLQFPLNAVVNGVGRNYHTPIEMSYQAPFVDAAVSIDPTNRENTFISYYTYGSILGLALDLSLRSAFENKNLDGYFKVLWNKFGKDELPYTIQDLKQTLATYTNNTFSNQFFDHYIYQSDLPSFDALLQKFGVILATPSKEQATFSVMLTMRNNQIMVGTNPLKGSGLYEAGISINDRITAIDQIPVSNLTDINNYLMTKKPGDQITLEYQRWGVSKSTHVKLDADNRFQVSVDTNATPKALQLRKKWLQGN
jgi:predicted metalloprotease with PDZ domain